MFRLRFLLVIAFLLLGAAAMAADLSTKMVMINKRPMISLKDFAETFDATVDYKVDTDEISISLDDTTVYLVPYRMTAYVNDRKVWLDMPVVIVDDVTYLPLRFVADTFNLGFNWLPADQQVILVYRQPVERRIIFAIDLDWCRRPHVWRHDYDFHWYVNFHTPHHNNDGDHHDGYNNHGDGGHADGNNQHGSGGQYDGNNQHGDGGHYDGNNQHDGAPSGSPRPSKEDYYQRPPVQQHNTTVNHDAAGAQNGGHDGKPDAGRPHDTIVPPTAGPNQHDGPDRPGDKPQHGEYGKPDGDVQRPPTGGPQPGGYGQQNGLPADRPNAGKEDGKYDRPTGDNQHGAYDRPDRPAGAGSQRDNPYTPGKDQSRPGGYAGRQDPQPSASAPQASAQQPRDNGRQKDEARGNDRREKSEARDNDRREKDSKDSKDSDRENRDKDSGDNGDKGHKKDK
ncbi:MAG TPA: stalk domain-containing protein [Armatimonadota bacterium]